MYRNRKPAAGIIVLNHARTHILCVFPTGQFGGLLYTIPKGKLDAGEKHEECARREFQEETGIPANLLDIKERTFCVLKGDTSINVYFLAKFKNVDSEALIHQFKAPINEELGFPESQKNEWIRLEFIKVGGGRKDKKIARMLSFPSRNHHHN